MNFRKTVSALLAAALMLSALPQKALAWQSERHWFQTEPMEAHMSRTASAGPVLAEGHYEHYQDRLTGLPAYALDFYSWLERNATADGALADPAQGIAHGSDYYCKVTRISGSQTFTFESVAELDSTAASIAREAVNRELKTFSLYAGAMYSAFDREHPEVFWLNGRSKYGAQCGYTYSARGNSCTVSYDLDMLFWLKSGSFDVRIENYRSKAAVAEGIAQRDAAVQEILDGCTATEPYEQIRYLNWTLAQRNAYNRAVAEGRSDEAGLEIRECISALTGRAGDQGPVCEGYARAFMLLCQKLGIHCVLADGKARAKVGQTPEDHMWNYVLLGDNWYAVDVTWNDPYVPWLPEQKSSGYETEDWFLAGTDSQVSQGLSFVQSHIETNDISGNGLCYTNGPVLSPKAYDPNAVTAYRVGGTVTAFGDSSAPVLLELGDRSLDLTGKPGEYCFEKVLPGAYILTVGKANHVTRQYGVTVDADVVQDVKIHLIGDITGDGRVNVADTSKVYSHVKGSAPLTDYAFACGDVDGNGRINVADTSKVYSHVKGTKALW